MKVFNLILFLFSLLVNAQVLNHKKEFTRQDSLRGSNNEFRSWWNVLHYKISVEPDFSSKFIKGNTSIEFQVSSNPLQELMQIDLQEPMRIDEVLLDNKFIPFKRDGNVYFLEIGNKLKVNSTHFLSLRFSGNPKVAVNPPWDGGWIFKKDKQGREWMSVACQGLGASVWYPNKDYQGDEPEKGASLEIIVPKGLVGVGNGKLISKTDKDDKSVYLWEVKNPINNYNIIPYIGHYKEFTDSYDGENGKLKLDYWVLDYNLEKAKKQFTQVQTMLKSFEGWFGPYPFYEDSYKLVESPHLGMEHQSAVAYGNQYLNGYLGNDLSRSGWGLKWDFIIIHESGHEWFGNNITTNDVADMWVHEAFTSYSEVLYTEDLFGKEAGSDYAVGTRLNIINDMPIIGYYGVNQEGSGDMYNKGANMIHTLRQLMEDDVQFKNMLRGLNKEFYHQTVTTKQIEEYISKTSKIDLTEFFNQYLRTTKIPKFEYKINGNKISFRWTEIVEGFDMPVKIANSEKWLYPTSVWKTEELSNELISNFKIDRNFYIETNQLSY